MAEDRVKHSSAMRQDGGRVLGRKDWSGFEFTPAMVTAAQANHKNTSYWWQALRESGYVSAAIAAGGGVIQ